MDTDQQDAKSDWHDVDWALLVLAIAAGAYSEMSLPLAWEPSRFWRLTMGVAHVALIYGLAWLVGSLGILITEPRRRSPRKWTLVGATLLLTAMTIYGSRNLGHVPPEMRVSPSAQLISSPTQLEEVDDDGMLPYNGPVYSDASLFPTAQVLIGTQCTSSARTLFAAAQPSKMPERIRRPSVVAGFVCSAMGGGTVRFEAMNLRVLMSFSVRKGVHQHCIGLCPRGHRKAS